MNSKVTKNTIMGSIYWANSYIILKDGRKIYLENHVHEVEAKINSSDEILFLNISDLDGNAIRVARDSILHYGHV